MRIAIIGTGYVGLVTGAGLAEHGHEVTCVDIDHDRIERLARGEVPIHEPGLVELVQRNRALGRLGFTTETRAAVAGARAVFIAVGTPSGEAGAADLAHVLDAAREIGRSLEPGALVITKSTVPVGTAERVRVAVGEHARGKFAVASNPEFLREGNAIVDFMHPARVVIGSDDPQARAILRALYSTLCPAERILEMDLAGAELTKYAANAMLATRISFMNELARLADAIGADIEDVRRGVGSDPRIGTEFLHAGCGFGGSCFPKDLRALIHTGRMADVPLTIVEAAAHANEQQQRSLGRRLIAHFGGNLASRKVAIWGLAFKPDTDDIRESPALALIAQLREVRAAIRRLRSGRDGQRAGPARRGARARARSVRSRARRRRARARHRVARAAPPRSRAARAADAHADPVRRPERLDARRGAARGLRLSRDRPALITAPEQPDRVAPAM
jgi:UDPglucose 6-dehydrogenase